MSWGWNDAAEWLIILPSSRGFLVTRSAFCWLLAIVVNMSANSLSCTLSFKPLDHVEEMQHHVYKATVFWIVLQKRRSVFTGWTRGWAPGYGACTFLQHGLVCHLTVDCCSATTPPPNPLRPPLSKQLCYIFHSKNPRGHRHVWLFVEARWEFSYKQVYRRYLYGLWHLTPQQSRIQ